MYVVYTTAYPVHFDTVSPILNREKREKRERKNMINQNPITAPNYAIHSSANYTTTLPTYYQQSGKIGNQGDDRLLD